MKKKVIILTVVIIILLLIIILAVSKKDGRDRVSTDPKSQKPSIIKNIPYPTLSDESNISPLPEERLGKIIFKDVLLDFLGDKLPDGITLAMITGRKSGSKVSPDGLASAELSENKLIIRNTGKNREIVTAMLSENTKDANFIWLNNDYLVLIDKEKEERGIDRIYLVDKYQGNKAFAIASFPIPERINLEIEPVVLNEFGDVLVADNEGKYWEISMVY